MDKQQTNETTMVDQPELKYWSEEFGISEEELKREVKAGSTPAHAVEKFVMRETLIEAGS